MGEGKTILTFRFLRIKTEPGAARPMLDKSRFRCYNADKENIFQKTFKFSGVSLSLWMKAKREGR